VRWEEGFVGSGDGGGGDGDGGGGGKKAYQTEA